jgi:NAD(P)-dependent dehydrogenase (short-subunit alcohol dehydrogenase family)
MTDARPAALITGAAVGIGAARVAALEAGGWQIGAAGTRLPGRSGHVAADLAAAAAPDSAARQALRLHDPA